MAIKAKFNLDKIFADIERELGRLIRQAIIDAFDKTLLDVLIQAKTLDTYKDQTSLLRHSIGYQIYDNGELVTQRFEKNARIGDGSGADEGITKGQRVAAEVARKYPNDIVGVIVAGAEYAIYVESKGYDVLSGPASNLATIASMYLKEAAQGFKEAGSK